MKKVVRQPLAQLIPLNAPRRFQPGADGARRIGLSPNGAPECDRCPAAGVRVAYRENKTALLPVKGAKKSRTIENRTVYLLFYNGKVARWRPVRPAGGLWEFSTSWRDACVRSMGLSTLTLFSGNSAAPMPYSPTGKWHDRPAGSWRPDQLPRLGLGGQTRPAR